MTPHLERNKYNVIDRYGGATYIQHNPEVGDGKQAFIDYFEQMAPLDRASFALSSANQNSSTGLSGPDNSLVDSSGHSYTFDTRDELLDINPHDPMSRSCLQPQSVSQSR